MCWHHFFWGGWWVLQYLVVSTGIHMESSLQKFSGSSAVSLANQRPWIRDFWEEKNRRQTWRWKGARNLIELGWTLGLFEWFQLERTQEKEGSKQQVIFFGNARWRSQVSSYTPTAIFFWRWSLRMKSTLMLILEKENNQPGFHSGWWDLDFYVYVCLLEC